MQKYIDYYDTVAGKHLGRNVAEEIRKVEGQLAIIGGGMVSPDNLLSSGEGFIRNYLLGKLWLGRNSRREANLPTIIRDAIRSAHDYDGPG